MKTVTVNVTMRLEKDLKDGDDEDGHSGLLDGFWAGALKRNFQFNIVFNLHKTMCYNTSNISNILSWISPPTYLVKLLNALAYNSSIIFSILSSKFLVISFSIIVV